jgi:inosose dehydratase
MTTSDPHAPALHVAGNQYPWMTFAERDGGALDPRSVLAGLAASGLQGYEPIISGPADVQALAPLLAEHGLQLRSIYVNTTLHQPEAVERSSADVLAVAEAAQRLGTRLIVVNPNPIRWGGPEAKDDAALATQAAALNALGRQLAARGLVLAYHYHEGELRHAARELHHMLLATDPLAVGLCLDAQWIHRGAGDSFLAVADIVQLYGRRTVEVHLRQSLGGIWTEAFGPGDIDYPSLAQSLLACGAQPHIVLEQAVEPASPQTMGPVEAHRRGLEVVRRMFAGFALG